MAKKDNKNFKRNSVKITKAEVKAMKKTAMSESLVNGFNKHEAIRTSAELKGHPFIKFGMHITACCEGNNERIEISKECRALRKMAKRR